MNIEETEIEVENLETFADFELKEELLKAVNELGYETPSPIQLKTIPLLLEGSDIVGQAQTGTGKTAAFALPALQKIDTQTSKIQVLVLTPTRELAIQVAEAFHSYAKHLGRIRVLPVYGGQAISQQMKHLRSGVQVIVGTPGRVMDHIRRETIDLTTLKMVVLDEADEMLRMGFQEDVEWILSHTPETRQTALFSATMPKQVRRIADKYLRDAVNIETERKTMTVPTIKQFYVNVSEGQKTDALTRILEADATSGEAVLIFHRTKIGADKLTEKLQARGYAAEAMHGDMNQNQRESVIKRLRTGLVEIVVATDVAARGLDVEQITSVINYDIPGDTESYVHRIGRTGRAGREGKAILFVTPRQQRMMREIEKYTKQKIEPLKMPTKADVAARRVAMLKERIVDTLTNQNLELYLSLVEEIAEENGSDIAEIAAAAAFLTVGDKPLQVKAEPKSTQPTNWGDGMTRLFIDVGRGGGIGPSDVVGAIANEGNVPGKAIGAIDIYDDYTLVDVPTEFVEQLLEQMRNTHIRGQKANVRAADSDEKTQVKSARPRDFDRPRSFDRPKSFDRPRDSDRPRNFDRPKSFDRPRDFDRSRDSERPKSFDRPKPFDRSRPEKRGDFEKRDRFEKRDDFSNRAKPERRERKEDFFKRDTVAKFANDDRPKRTNRDENFLPEDRPKYQKKDKPEFFEKITKRPKVSSKAKINAKLKGKKKPKWTKEQRERRDMNKK